MARTKLMSKDGAVTIFLFICSAAVVLYFVPVKWLAGLVGSMCCYGALVPFCNKFFFDDYDL